MSANSASEANSGKKLLSIVLPVYNEEAVLPLLTAKIAKSLWPSGLDYEMIFVNDGSRDDSGKLLDEMASTSNRIRVVHLSRNFGHQAAIQAGLAHARGDAVVLMDSDLQDAPEAIPKMAAQWQAGYDVVYAIRTNRKEGPWKKFCIRAFYRLMSRTASIPLPAEAGNFSLIDRRVAHWIMTLRECDRYLPGLRSWVGFKQIGIEVERNARYDKQPRVSLGGLFRLAKSAIYSFSSLPLTLIQAIGIAAAAAFIGLGGYAVFCKLITGWALPGWTSPMLLGSFFGALNALGITVLGEYVIRIYDQVRGRPLYLVDHTVNMDAYESSGQNKSVSAKPPIALAEEDFSGDELYQELMDEAINLLQAGSQARETTDTLNIAPESVDYESEEIVDLHQ
jgi:dolichol-phosphate mannosyltransferase